MAKQTIEARWLTQSDLLKLIGRSHNWFKAHLKDLKDQGFPGPDPLIKLYDKKAIEAWGDKRSGFIVDENPDEAEALRRIHGKH